MVVTADTSDTARLIALRLHWVAAVLLALELVTASCKTAPPSVPSPANPPAATPGDNPDAPTAPRTSMVIVNGRTECGWGR